MNREEISLSIKRLEDSFKTTSERLKKAGLIVPQKPQDAIEGIDLYQEWETMKKRHGGVANIPFSELGEFLDKWTALIAYSRWVEAVADIDQNSAREARDTVRKQLYTVHDGGRELRDALVTIEPLFIKYEQEYTEKMSLYLAVKGLREGYEQRASAISREITRRSADNSDARRQMNRGNVL